MSDMIIALMPLFCMSFFYYGPRVFLVGGVSVLTCLLADWMCSLLLHQKINPRDLSPVVTGLIITMLVPPAVALYVVVWAALFAILVAKAPFGGTGHNIFNPAAAGLAFSTICWSGQMFGYTSAMQRLPMVIDETVRFVQGPTAALKVGGISRIGLTELLLGNFPGPIGSTHTLIIFACLIYLVARSAVRWYLPLSYVAAVSLLSACFRPFGVTPLESIANELFAGSLFFLVVKGVGGSQLRCDPQGEFKSREETFQGDCLLQLIIQVRQLQQLFLPLPVQHLMEVLVDRFQLLSDFPALRLPTEPLVQGHHVILHRIASYYDSLSASLCSVARMYGACGLRSATHNTPTYSE